MLDEIFEFIFQVVVEAIFEVVVYVIIKPFSWIYQTILRFR
ncbi:hypothetical protein [Alkaliphilus serpentinus]|nr:hypothetical protein [Alkaliphilus serpentinus]